MQKLEKSITMKKIRIFSGFSGFKDNRVKILKKNLISSWYLIIMKPAIALDSILQAYEARNLLGGHNFLTYTLSAHCGPPPASHCGIFIQ